MSADGGWHVPDEELRRYAGGRAGPPGLWSIESHLTACAGCRERLAAGADPDLVPAGWARLDAELDAPARGPLELVLVRLGVPEHTARLLVAVPAMRLSWLVSVALTLAITAAAGNAAKAMAAPILYLAIAPLLTLGGVALSFGPGVDPTHELTLVAPIHTLRLLLLRCAAVLATTTGLTAAASLALPGYGLVVLGWLLPALTMTLLSLALTPRFGPVYAAAGVGTGWLVLVLATVRFSTGESAVFAPAGQVTLGAGAVLAAAALMRVRSRFETGRRLDRPLLTDTRRIR
jgi:hypothetical protein